MTTTTDELTTTACNCGCADSDTTATDCTCGCECCEPSTQDPKDEIAQLQESRAAIDRRLSELGSA